MPSDANGVYSLPPAYHADAGTKIQPLQHNTPLEDLATAMTGRLPRTGAAAMTGPLKVVPGSAAAPGLAVDGAPGHGLFKTAGGLGVSINGVMVAEFTAAGILKSSRYVGELFPWTGSTAPALCVLPFGQTLSRSTYADLWAFAQAEIAAGNTFFNNGNGTTTFGIADLRGRALAAKDNMGGTDAGRLTIAGGGVDGQTIGAAGGGQSFTLATQHLPPYTPAGAISVTNGAITINNPGVINNAGGNLIPGGGSLGNSASLTVSQAASTATFNGAPQGGSSTPIRTVQPSIITNYALFAGA